MIRSFRNKATEAVFNGETPKGFPADLVKVRAGNCATSTPRETSVICGRLQVTALKRWPVIARGNTRFRINDQFRVCFVWTAEGPADVEIVDYR